MIVKNMIKTVVLLCCLAGCCETHHPIENSRSDELRRLGMLRENMPRSQVEKILQPLKAGPGMGGNPIEFTYYRLSSESGVWICYIRQHGERSEDKMAVFGGGLKLGVLDNKTGKWSDILVPPRK